VCMCACRRMRVSVAIPIEKSNRDLRTLYFLVYTYIKRDPCAKQRTHKSDDTHTCMCHHTIIITNNFNDFFFPHDSSFRPRGFYEEFFIRLNHTIKASHTEDPLSSD
jgi:hypothetical protein